MKAMHVRFLPLLVVSIALLTLAACNVETAVTEPPPTAIAPLSMSLAVPADVERTAEAMAPVVRHMNASLGEFVELTREAASWADADLAVRAALAAPSEAPAYIRQQVAANVMLRTHLLKGEATQQRQRTAAYYTELLIHNESAQADLIADALDLLDGYWADEQRSAMAALAAQAAEKRLAERLDCETCTYEELQRRLSPRISDQMQRNERAGVEGIERLRAIVG